MNELDTKYMKEAIKQAKKALKLKEVPIGCVIVYQDKIIARGYNRRNTDKTTLGHAEITAIKKPAALSATGGWKTAQYILHLNLPDVCRGDCTGTDSKGCYRIDEPKAGCGGSVLNILQMEQFNHRCEVTRGVLEEECSTMLSSFFKQLRQEKAKRREPS